MSENQKRKRNIIIVLALIALMFGFVFTYNSLSGGNPFLGGNDSVGGIFGSSPLPSGAYSGGGSEPTPSPTRYTGIDPTSTPSVTATPERTPEPTYSGGDTYYTPSPSTTPRSELTYLFLSMYESQGKTSIEYVGTVLSDVGNLDVDVWYNNQAIPGSEWYSFVVHIDEYMTGTFTVVVPVGSWVYQASYNDEILSNNVYIEVAEDPYY